MSRSNAILLACSLLVSGGRAVAQTGVPAAPPATAVEQTFHDSHYGVRFVVPPGWALARKDRQVSTFRLDARSATRRSEMRAVSSMEFNPFPLSTFSGAFFYYSVQRHTNDAECARQAYRFGKASGATEAVGGMDFQHGHDEQGRICIESRDDVYTAFRKGSCYRFDLTVNTFCAVSSGAAEMTEGQMRDIEQRMEGILFSVAFDGKAGQRKRDSNGASSLAGRRPAPAAAPSRPAAQP